MRWSAAIVIVVIPAFLGCVSDASPLIAGETRTLAPGEFLEVNLDMAPGDAFVATFTSDGALEWDVHSHGPDDEAVVHREGEGSTDTVRFEAGDAGVHSLFLYRPPGAEGPATVTVEVRGTATLRSITP